MAKHLIAICLAMLVLCFPAATARTPDLFVDHRSTTVEAAEKLDGEERRDALLLATIPSGSWFAHGTPDFVEAKVRDLVGRAAAEARLPVIVAYNIPFRDCSLYSAGGAADTDAYLRWIGGLAAGIGSSPAIVILEPDGLGIIPWHRTLVGELDACQPEGQGEGAAVRRYEELRGAVAVLAELPNVRVYLDGTGSSWLTPGEITSRLIRADVGKTAGFFLNVSNFESDTRVIPYARWVSDCIALVTHRGLDARECPSQFDPASFDNEATWAKTDAAYDQLFEKAGLKRNPDQQLHAVIDTSRNGKGSWKPPTAQYRDAETWCNPPGRGLGRRPTLESGEPYVDAFLWIKVPGESDGECLRGTGGPADPERGVMAPPAGHWFPAQARELIQLANPPLTSE